jgi:hypothetical protein
MRLLPRVVAASLSVASAVACTGARYPERPTARVIFDAVAPSVLAIVNDDREEREVEAKRLEDDEAGGHTSAPRKVVDVSRKQDSPDGTGFVIEGGLVATAAHVVLRPDLLKLRTREGKMVDADLLAIDEIRDVALLKPRQPIPEVPPLPLEEHDVHVGEPVWAMGHTGPGFWQLSWGISEGIASGFSELFGAKLLLFDAAVYPGFSGGPVVTFHEGRPEVAGVNHAILFTGSTASVFSAIAASELRALAQGARSPLEQRLAAYADMERRKLRAEVILTERLVVSKDASGRHVASLLGETRAVDATAGSDVRLSAAAMLFGLAPGPSTLVFQAKDRAGKIVAQETKKVAVEGGVRVVFAHAQLVFQPRGEGTYVVEVLREGQVLGKAGVEIELQGADEDDHDHDPMDALGGDPIVQAFVATGAREEPFALSGIRGFWREKSYPRRTALSWMMRGSRGWSGDAVVATAYVIDDEGHVTGQVPGCIRPMRPAKTWMCAGTSGRTPPLLRKAGQYDIVFALNGRPVAWWPMEAIVENERPGQTDAHRWLKNAHGGSR